MTLQTIINQVKDFVSLFNIGDSSDERIIRAINRATEYYQRVLGLPCCEFSQEVDYYGEPEIPVNDDVNEIIFLGFYDETKNKDRNEFIYVMDRNLIQQYGNSIAKNLVSFNIINGVKTLYIKPYWDFENSETTIESFDSFATTSNISAILSASTDISSISGENDEQNYKEGDASLFLSITASSATPKLVIPAADKITMSGLTTYKDIFTIWVYLNSTTKNYFSSSKLLYTENSVNYTINGSFIFPKREGWNLIKFNLRDVNNFDYSELTDVKLEFDFSGASGTFDINIDYLCYRIPERLLLKYYTNYKGKDASGNYITDFSATTDVPLFSGIADDLILPISLKASLFLSPQLKSDPNFIAFYNAEAKDTIKQIGRTYPRKRLLNYGEVKFEK